MTLFCCPKGHFIQGTLEQVRGVGNAVLTKSADGKIEIEHTGRTDIWWEEQETILRDGKIVFVCDHGCECTEDETTMELDLGKEKE